MRLPRDEGPQRTALGTSHTVSTMLRGVAPTRDHRVERPPSGANGECRAGAHGPASDIAPGETYLA